MTDISETANRLPLPDGRHRTVDPDSGAVVQDITVHDGCLEGPATFYQGGEKVMDLTFSGGLKSGPAVIYVRGRPQSRLMFENDRLNGSVETLDLASGQVMARIPHVAGQPDGEARYHDPDGNLVRTETFKSGQRDGPATDFQPGGALVARRQFMADVPEGRHVTFYPDGKPQEVRLYQNGQLVGREIYGPDGQRMVAQGTLAPPPPAGPWWKRLFSAGGA